MTSKQPAQRPEQSGADAGLTAVASLMSGVIVWGAVGWLLDWWLGIPKHFGTAVGILVGAATAIYIIVKRFGSSSS